MCKIVYNKNGSALELIFRVVSGAAVVEHSINVVNGNNYLMSQKSSDQTKRYHLQLNPLVNHSLLELRINYQGVTYPHSRTINVNLEVMQDNRQIGVLSISAPITDNTTERSEGTGATLEEQ